MQHYTLLLRKVLVVKSPKHIQTLKWHFSTVIGTRSEVCRCQQMSFCQHMKFYTTYPLCQTPAPFSLVKRNTRWNGLHRNNSWQGTNKVPTACIWRVKGQILSKQYGRDPELTFTRTDSSEWRINFAFSDGMNPEYLDRTHTDEGRACKLNTERPPGQELTQGPSRWEGDTATPPYCPFLNHFCFTKTPKP